MLLQNLQNLQRLCKILCKKKGVAYANKFCFRMRSDVMSDDAT